MVRFKVQQKATLNWTEPDRGKPSRGPEEEMPLRTSRMGIVWDSGERLYTLPPTH
jgi:hypothetical protein